MLVYHSIFEQYVDVTESEKKLLGVKDGEIGFRKCNVKTTQDTTQQSIKFSPSCYSQATRLSPNASMRLVVLSL